MQETSIIQGWRTSWKYNLWQFWGFSSAAASLRHRETILALFCNLSWVPFPVAFYSFPSVPWLLYYCTVFIHLSGHQGLRPKANILMGVLDTQQIHALFCYMSWVPFLVAFHSFPWSLVVFFVFFPTWVSSMNFRRSHFSINDLMPTHCTGPSQRKDNSTARRMYESKTHVRTIIKIRAS